VAKPVEAQAEPQKPAEPKPEPDKKAEQAPRGKGGCRRLRRHQQHDDLGSLPGL